MTSRVRGVYRAEREADSAAHTCRQSVIYKTKIAYGVRTQGFINLNIFWRTQNLASGRTHIFSNDPTHSFINETPENNSGALLSNAKQM